MSIKTFSPRSVELGKIKLGYKGEKRQGKRGEYRLPQKSDEFIITSMEKDGQTGNFIPNMALISKLKEKMGAPPKLGTEDKRKLRELSIRLPYDNIDLNFHTFLGYYHGKKRLCWNSTEDDDATKCVLDNNNQPTGKFEKRTCPCDLYTEKKGCKEHGILSVILEDDFKIGGVYQFRTTGYHSVNSITNSMMQISSATNGILAGLPLKMRMLPRTSGEGNFKFWYVTLYYDKEHAELVADTQKIANLRALSASNVANMEGRLLKSKLMIESGSTTAEFIETEDDETQADVQEEFMPDDGEQPLPSWMNDGSGPEREDVQDAEVVDEPETKTEAGSEPDPAIVAQAEEHFQDEEAPKNELTELFENADKEKNIDKPGEDQQSLI